MMLVSMLVLMYIWYMKCVHAGMLTDDDVAMAIFKVSNIYMHASGMARQIHVDISHRL